MVNAQAPPRPSSRSRWCVHTLVLAPRRARMTGRESTDRVVRSVRCERWRSVRWRSGRFHRRSKQSTEAHREAQRSLEALQRKQEMGVYSVLPCIFVERTPQWPNWAAQPMARLVYFPNLPVGTAVVRSPYFHAQPYAHMLTLI